MVDEVRRMALKVFRVTTSSILLHPSYIKHLSGHSHGHETPQNSLMVIGVTHIH